MKKVVRHIEYLLQSRDCVIVPGLGAVLAHSKPAFYDESTSVWFPPERAFAFNPALTRTDGLLAGSVARRDNISHEAAARVVSTAVSEMRHDLERTHTLELGAAGTLRLTDEGRLSFEPGNAAALSPSYCWLPEIRQVKVSQESARRRARAEAETRRSRRAAAWRRAGNVAACIALLIGLGWIVATNLTYAPQEQLASVAPMTVEQSSTAQTDKPAVLILAAPPAEEIQTESADIRNIDASQDVNTSEHRIAPVSDYYLIVGSFNSEAEAKKYIRLNNDIDLGILAKDGRWRVYAASGASAAEVMAEAKTEPIASRYPSTWVCRR